MGSFNLDCCIHAANIILRLFAVAPSTIAMPCFLFPTPLWAAFAGSVLLPGINPYPSWRLCRERRPVKLRPGRRTCGGLSFGSAASGVLRVLSIGPTAELGERLIECGKAVDSISLIVHGQEQMMMAGRLLGDREPAEIVGTRCSWPAPRQKWMP